MRIKKEGCRHCASNECSLVGLVGRVSVQGDLEGGVEVAVSRRVLELVEQRGHIWIQVDRLVVRFERDLAILVHITQPDREGPAVVGLVEPVGVDEEEQVVRIRVVREVDHRSPGMARILVEAVDPDLVHGRAPGPVAGVRGVANVLGPAVLRHGLHDAVAHSQASARLDEVPEPSVADTRIAERCVVARVLECPHGHRVGLTQNGVHLGEGRHEPVLLTVSRPQRQDGEVQGA